MEISTRCCNSLAIMQCIAMHPETRTVFIESNVPLYIFPFINIRHHKSVNLEKIRLTGLGVFGSLLQSNDPEVVKYLIQTEIVPLCLKILREATEISQTVAAYIIQKILIDRQGLEYVCATSDRFFSVSDVLIETVEKMINKNSIRLLKHIIHCYLCLSANRKARNALRKCLPSALRTNAFEHLLSRDSDAQKWLNQLIHNLSLRD
ncbi:Cell differentiation protein RCD1 [Bonamia ostreae]|uniref:Cell differentiation protein RCD1 n=1 Tax=Bonamia ostreae TaxID=126728 RepID=A0ABV2ARX2_9EUKA